MKKTVTCVFIFCGMLQCFAAAPLVAITSPTNGVLALQGGNLGQAWTNAIVLIPGNRLTNAGPNELTISLAPSTGLFKGRFIDPVSDQTAAFSGVVLQKSVAGAGYFLGTNESGRVWIESRP